MAVPTPKKIGVTSPLVALQLKSSELHLYIILFLLGASESEQQRGYLERTIFFNEIGDCHPAFPLFRSIYPFGCSIALGSLLSHSGGRKEEEVPGAFPPPPHTHPQSEGMRETQGYPSGEDKHPIDLGLEYSTILPGLATIAAHQLS